MLFIKDVDLTPNPQALKFILNKALTTRASRFFAEKEEAENDPLASKIFGIKGVSSVFYKKDFLTVEKQPSASWLGIQEELINLIETFDEKIIPPENEFEISRAQEEVSEIPEKITAILDSEVRPLLEGDGGGLEIISFEDNVLKIKYQGACKSCPIAIIGTLKVIEQLLQRKFNPEIKVVAE